MSGVPFSDMDDAVLVTQEALIKRGAFADLQDDLTDYVFMREFWKRRRNKFEGGHPWRFYAQMDHNHSARAVASYETDGTALTDTMAEGEVEPRFVNASYIYDILDPAFQRGGHAIVDLVQSRYTAMMYSFYSKCEGFLASKPTDSTDKKTPYGIEYWILKHDDSSGGFYAQNPSGFTSGRGNIDSSTYARHANWSASYTTVSMQDLVRKIRDGDLATRFRSVVSHPQPDFGSASNGKYTNREVLGLMEELLQAENMGLANDLNKYGGRTMINSTPVVYVPKLDDDTENPVYSIDWQWFAVGVMSGWEERLSPPAPVPNKSTVRRVDLHACFQTVCTNLRRQAVYYVPS